MKPKGRPIGSKTQIVGKSYTFTNRHNHLIQFKVAFYSGHFNLETITAGTSSGVKRITQKDLLILLQANCKDYKKILIKVFNNDRLNYLLFKGC